MPLLDGEPVDNSVIDPKKHKFVGMFRHPTCSTLYGKGYVQCPCGQVLQTQQAVFDHWHAGHLDVPLYKTLDEKEN